MNVYIVMASHGEWSERVEWPVLAYMNEKDAQDKVEHLSSLVMQWEHFLTIENTWPENTENMSELEYDEVMADFYAIRDTKSRELFGIGEEAYSEDTRFFIASVKFTE